MYIRDDWIINHLPSTAPDMAKIALAECHAADDREVYLHMRMFIRNRLKVLEKYGIVRWTGKYQMITNTAAKIYEVSE